MVENIPMVSPKATVKEVTQLLTRHARDYASVAYIYLVSPSRKLEGIVSIKEILTHSPQTIVAAIAETEVVSVVATDRAETVALTAINHNVKAVPVIKASTGVLLGVITADRIMDIMHSGRIHDSLIASGTQTFADPTVSILAGTPMIHVKKRLPWLLFGLFGGLVAASIVQRFEGALAAEVLIVAFIPLVVYLADAVGSQTEIIFVRAVALDPKLGTWKRFLPYFYREFIVTLVLALILALCMAVLSTWWFAAPQLVWLLVTAIITTLLLSTVVALVIPYLALRLRYDPALTSGPVATVIRDVMTLVIYFIVVAVYLHVS